MNTLKHNKWFWAFLVLLLVNLSALGTMFYMAGEMRAYHSLPDHPPFRSRHPHPMVDKMDNYQLQKHLGLSKEEMKKFRSIRRQHAGKMTEARVRLRNLQAELFDEISADKPDSARIKTLEQALLQQHQQMIQESAKFYRELRKNCDEQQLRKINRFFKKRMMAHPHNRPTP